jgi:hypothetical protein
MMGCLRTTGKVPLNRAVNFRLNLKTAVARTRSSQDLGDKAVCRDAPDPRGICAATPHHFLAQAFANLGYVQLPF